MIAFLYAPGPLLLQVPVSGQDVLSGLALPKEGDQHLDALVGALLIVVLAARDGFKETVPGGVIVGDTFQRLEDPVRLPGVLHRQHCQQQVQEWSEQYLV